MFTVTQGDSRGHGIFTPACEGARVAIAKLHDGTEQRLLVIVTTAELDPMSHKFKKKTVQRLSHAAQEYLADTAIADGFVMINRLKDGHADRT